MINKKRLALVISAAVIILCACLTVMWLMHKKNSADGKNLSENVYIGKIIKKTGEYIIAAADEQSKQDNALCQAALKNVKITGENGKKTGKSKLSAGMTVRIKYRDGLSETFPAKTDLAYEIDIISAGDDLVGFYIDVIDDLYKTDTALNDDISCIAFDLSKVENLSKSEKSGLILLCNQKFNIETIEGTFDSLCEFGYIDKEKMYFENGVLFTVEQTAQEKNKFTFNIQKWRSGLGAYYFNGCTAEKSDKGWNYEIGSEMIS